MKLVWLAVDASHVHRSPALPLVHAACAGVEGVSWKAVRALPQADPSAVAAAICEAQPDAVAATLYLFNRRMVLEVLARVKVLQPTCWVVVGGPECLGDNADLLRDNRYLDLAVRGEGEEAMPALLGCLRRGERPAGLPGVCWRDAAGQPQDDGSRAVYAAWAGAPPASVDPLYEAGGPFAYIETSRGCAGCCSYCTSCATPLRYRPVEAIRDEVAGLQGRGIREVRLLDRTFNVPGDRAARLLELFLTEFAGMAFHLEVEPAHLDAGLRTLLAKAPPGALRVEAGVQTLAPAALAAVQRHASPEAVLDGIGFLVGCTGVTTHVDLLAGLPGQTLAEVERDVEAMLALGPAEIQLETLKVLPGTPLRDQAAALGLRHAPGPPYEVLRTPSMDLPALRRAVHWSRVLDGFHNAPALRPALRAGLGHPGAFADFAEGCCAAGLTDGPSNLERRFRHLHKTLGQPRGEVSDRLRQGWMEAGLSPADPLAAAEPARTVPTGLEWRRGNRDCAASRTARIWRLRLTTAETWFIYDRARSGSIPVAWGRSIAAPPPGASPRP